MAGRKNRAQSRASVVVVNKRSNRKRNTIVQPTYKPMSLRFDAASNGLMEKMSGMQNRVATGALGSGMFGTTGNFYLDTIVDPFRDPVRIPDEYARPTGVHQSFRYFTVTTDDNGEATILFNPILGDGATLAFRQRWVTVVEPDVGGVPVATYYDDPDLALFVGATPIVNGIRPVSAAMLVSYIGDTLTDGGQISASWLPGDVDPLLVNSFINTGGLSPLSLVPGAYTGPLSKGAYVFWKPDDIEDYQLLTQAASLAHLYPTLAVAIKSTKNNTVTVRVSAVLNTEFTTTRRVCESRSGMVEPDLMIHAKKILSTFPCAVANDGHVTLWQRIMKGCTDFFQVLGNSIRNLFAPSLSAIAQSAPAITPLVSAGLSAAYPQAALATQLAGMAIGAANGGNGASD